MIFANICTDRIGGSIKHSNVVISHQCDRLNY